MLVDDRRRPRGIYGVITPWNFPVNIPVEYHRPGVATGNAVVWAPAPTTSLVAAELMAVSSRSGCPRRPEPAVGEGATAGDAVRRASGPTPSASPARLTGRASPSVVPAADVA